MMLNSLHDPGSPSACPQVRGGTTAMIRAFPIILACLACGVSGCGPAPEEIQPEAVHWTATVAHLAYKSGTIYSARKATQDYISALEKILATAQEASEAADTRSRLAWAVTRLAMIEEALGHRETAEQVYQRAAKGIASVKTQNTSLEDLKHYIVAEPYYDRVFGPLLDRARQATWKERKGNWETTTVDLLSTRSAGVRRVTARQCSYHIRLDPGRPDFGNESVLLTVFVTDSGQTWAGPEQDFYIETDSGVVGGNVSKWLLWCDSLLARRAGEKDAVDTLPARVDRQIGGYDLSNAQTGSIMDDDIYSDSILRERYSFYRDFLGQGFFETFVEPDGRAYRAAQVIGNTLRLDIRGRGGLSTASVFVEIKSRRVHHCTVDGRKVFP